MPEGTAHVQLHRDLVLSVPLDHALELSARGFSSEALLLALAFFRGVRSSRQCLVGEAFDASFSDEAKLLQMLAPSADQSPSSLAHARLVFDAPSRHAHNQEPAGGPLARRRLPANEDLGGLLRNDAHLLAEHLGGVQAVQVVRHLLLEHVPDDVLGVLEGVPPHAPPCPATSTRQR